MSWPTVRHPLPKSEIVTARDLDILNKLNLGCGLDIHADMINLDLHPLPGVDITHDINSPWPFTAARFTEIHANHVLEHCPSLIFQMNQAHRVLKPKGVLFISVPWFSGQWAHGDPQHIHFFDHHSFTPFAQGYDRYKHYGIKGPWLELSKTFQWEPPDVDLNWLREMGFSRCLGIAIALQRQS